MFKFSIEQRLQAKFEDQKTSQDATLSGKRIIQAIVGATKYCRQIMALKLYHPANRGVDLRLPGSPLGGRCAFNRLHKHSVPGPDQLRALISTEHSLEEPLGALNWWVNIIARFESMRSSDNQMNQPLLKSASCKEFQPDGDPSLAAMCDVEPSNPVLLRCVFPCFWVFFSGAPLFYGSYNVTPFKKPHSPPMNTAL